MHELYKEIDNSGYEDMPKEIYARWLRHGRTCPTHYKKNSEITILNKIWI